jgi:hypothetical protein
MLFRTRAALLSSCAVFADACAATTPPAGPPSLNICFTGALTGTAATVGSGSTCSSVPKAGDSFDVAYKTTVGGQETSFEVSAYKGPGTYTLESTDVNVNVAQSAAQKNWSGAVGGGMGSVTINPDRSGTVDASVPERDYNSGATKESAPRLSVKGNFRCPPSSS